MKFKCNILSKNKILIPNQKLGAKSPKPVSLPSLHPLQQSDSAPKMENDPQFHIGCYHIELGILLDWPQCGQNKDKLDL